MTSRFLAPAVLAAALAVPALGQTAPKPPMTVQVQPVGSVLRDIKAAAKLVLGDQEGEKAAKHIDETIKEGLGEKGFQGLDLTRPIGGYLYLPDKLDLTKFDEPDPADFKDVYGFLVLPVTGEKEFLEFLARVGPEGKKIEAEPVDGKKGLYELHPEDEDETPIPVRLRFHAGHAYIGINAPDEKLDPKLLVPVNELIVPGEKAHLAYRVYYQRLPAGLKKSFEEFLQKLPEKVDEAPIPDAGKAALKKLVDLYERIGKDFLEGGDVATERIWLDVDSGEFVIEAGVTAKPGTALAKEIAARKPTANQFAGLFGADTAAGYLVQLPTFAPELKDAAAIGLTEGEKMTAEMVPPEFKELAAEVWAGAARTVKSGEFDFGAALTGPDANGFFTAAVGLSYADTAKLEKLLRKLHADAPEEIQNMVKLDAAKVGAVSVHRMPVGLFLPPEAKKVFGDKASIAVAFAPNAVYLTFGPDSLAAMKAAVTAKPGPAKALDVVVNPARIGKLMQATKGEEADQVAKMIGTEDRLMSVYGLSVEGGKELKFRYTINLVPFGRGMFGTRIMSGPTGLKVNDDN